MAEFKDESEFKIDVNNKTYNVKANGSPKSLRSPFQSILALKPLFGQVFFYHAILYAPHKPYSLF